MDLFKDPIYYKIVRYNHLLVIIDCFSKFCLCFILKQKNSEQLINCYRHIIKTIIPKYMWWDVEKAVDSKKFSECLKDQ